jgi:hypothetical protein
MKLSKLHIEGLKPGKVRTYSFVSYSTNLLFKTMNTTSYHCTDRSLIIALETPLLLRSDSVEIPVLLAP